MMFSKQNRIIFILICIISISLSCTTSINVEAVTPPGVVEEICADMPNSLRAECAKLYQEGRRNWVLNNMNLGLNAFQLGYLDIAERCFEDAITGIETVYANNEQALKARGLWREEGSKDFKGEPYERAMAYYYLGLIDLMGNDIDNARASFRGGALQDAFAEEEQHRCDFALLVFLQGWCSQLLGDRSLKESAFEEIKNLRKNFSPPSSEDNTIFIVELGTSPRKRTDGIGHAQLRYFRGRYFSEDSVQVTINGKNLKGYPMESIFWQASTRGSRAIDFIQEGQVQFKTGTFEVGTAFSNEVLDDYAIIYSGTAAGTALNALGIIGGTIQLIAANMKVKADDRYWNNLPDSVHIITTYLPPGHHTAIFNFHDDNGNMLNELRKSLEFDVSNNSTNVVWIRSKDITVSSLNN